LITKTCDKLMNLRQLRDKLLLQEDLNFLLTNRIPRRCMTLLMGRVSRIQSPVFTRLGVALWKGFGDLDLSESQEQSFGSLQACFTRRLKEGSRPQDADPDVLTSPSDGIVGEVGRISQGNLLQAKGFRYRVDELLGGAQEAARWEGAHYVTLRLTSAMYHRFHAPAEGRMTHVRYISGDTWNVNPIALKRVERLFVRNERAVLSLRLEGGLEMALVPVAAVLVASIRLHTLNTTLNLRWSGAKDIACNSSFGKGEELGWFEHGSTIIVLAPASLQKAEQVTSGARIKVGQAMFRGLRQARAELDPQALSLP
jgi:phosphatidylserine decarboxylase